MLKKKSIIFTLLLTFLILKYPLFNKIKTPLKGHSLLLIAHPDDETMFFSPTILTTENIFILCLSANETRKKEFINWSNMTKLTVFALNFTDNDDWDEELICLALKKVYSVYKFDRIITFDKFGVSGHKNHISCHKAALKFIKEFKIEAMFLRSLGLFEKYIILLRNNYFFKNDFLGYFKAFKIMFCYKSQIIYYRILWLIFSNYMFYNFYD